MLARLGGLTPRNTRDKKLDNVMKKSQFSPQVVTVEGFTGEVPVPEHEVDLVGGVGRVDVTGQLRLAVPHCPHVTDWN